MTTSALTKEEIVAKIREDVDRADDIIGGLLAELHEVTAERDELSRAETRAQQAEAAYDEERRRHRVRVEDFAKAAEEAHRGARHDKPFDVCPHPICRRIEEWISAALRGLA